MTTRNAVVLARVLATTLVLTQASACSKVTMVSSEFPITVSAKPPAPPLPEWPTVPQPPPPKRVVVDGDLLTLDEALSFDGEDQLAADHADIVAEIAKWLADNPDVSVLTVEVANSGEGSKRKQQKRSKALATVVVDALVGQGIAAERLATASVDPVEGGQPQVSLRIQRAEASVGFEIEE